jgi:hypothetical protein
MANFRKLLRALLQPVPEKRTTRQRSANEPVGQKPTPVQRKVLKIVHNANVPNHDNRPLSQVLGWNDHNKLTEGYISDLKEISHGYANFEVVDTIIVDGFPVKEDGFAYTANEFVTMWKERKGFHQPDRVDYLRLVREFNMIERVDSGEIDEVWLFGFPYAGYYESHMAGPGAFWCNSPALKGTEHAKRRFIIMGYNYERGVGEMLENLGHRAESIMRYVYRDLKGQRENLWEKFARYDQTHPGKAEVGIMHFAPNSVRDYDWGNTTKVPSKCDNWLNFPDLRGEPRIVDCKDWGNGDIRAHHKWWFERLPHITGSAHNIGLNWWEYIIDPNTVD